MICVNCHTPIPENSQYCLACGADTSDPGTGPRPDLNAASSHLFTQLRAAVVQRYHLRELLGRGGMGAVFLATDRKLDRPVALKVLPPEVSHDANVVERFEREAKTAAKLDHPNIIPIYSVESHGEFHYFVMKYVNGRSLEQILSAGPMPVDVARRIIWEAACALGHAHQRGVVHRDIKPANIMIDEDGRAVLTDFGISKAVESAAHQLTATGQVVGTPHYMSPEQSKGVNVDGRSDQYSLAVVAYRIIAGKLPFDEDTIHAVLYKKIFEDAPWIKDQRADVPDYMAEALHKALSREPDNRYRTMEAFATAIWPENPVPEPGEIRSSVRRPGRTSIEGDTTELTPVATVEPPKQRKKRRAPVILGALAVVAAGGGGGWYVLNHRASAPEDQPTAQPPVAVASADSQQVARAESVTLDTSTTLAANQHVEQQEEQPPASKQPAPVSPPAEESRRPTETVRNTRTPEQQRPAAPQVGWVTINSVPFGSVWIDNVYVQETPLVRYVLTPGRHIIEIRREGYQTTVDTVVITANNEVRRRKTLVRQP
jgi:serine/threonine protein kinase